MTMNSKRLIKERGDFIRGVLSKYRYDPRRAIAAIEAAGIEVRYETRFITPSFSSMPGIKVRHFKFGGIA